MLGGVDYLIRETLKDPLSIKIFINKSKVRIIKTFSYSKLNTYRIPTDPTLIYS